MLVLNRALKVCLPCDLMVETYLRPSAGLTEHVQTGCERQNPSDDTCFCLSPPPQVMSAGRSADGREVQIPLQQVAPSLATPLSVAPPITPHSHRPANPWPPGDPAASQGTPPQLLSALRCDWLRLSVFRSTRQPPQLSDSPQFHRRPQYTATQLLPQ